MALDISGIMESAPQMFRDLPFIINLVQLVFYAGLVLTFGGFVMRAYKGHLSGPMKIVGRLAFGFLALVCGIGISWAIPPLSSVPIYAIMQAVFLNIIIGGVIATVVLYAVLRMISYNVFNLPGIDREIKHLEGMRKRAGEVEKEEKARNRRGIRHPVRLAGVVGLAAFLVIGLAGFQGFPDVLAELGFTQEDMESMAEQIEYVNEEYGDRIGEVLGDTEKLRECAGAMSLLQDQEAMSSMEPYTSAAVEGMVGEYTGEAVTGMYSIRSGPGFYVLALTQSRACLATLSVVCVCEDIADIQGGSP
jgi:hypothetical protein